MADPILVATLMASVADLLTNVFGFCCAGRSSCVVWGEDAVFSLRHSEGTATPRPRSNEEVNRKISLSPSVCSHMNSECIRKTGSDPANNTTI